MNKFIQPFIFLFCFFCSHAFSQVRQKKVVFIIVDGIPADVIEKVNTPALDEIAAQGKYMHAFVGGEKSNYTETPTISAVGYNSLLTGTWVNKHNVWDNDIKEPNYHYPTIFRLLKEQFPARKIAVFSSWTDNRTKLVGDHLATTGNIDVDDHADGFELDTLRFPHDKNNAYMHKIDEAVTKAAVEGIKIKAPDLSWVYLEYTDDMGHKFGDSPQYYHAIEQMDSLVGKVWQAVQLRQLHFNEDWLIVVTTDHGRDEKTGKGHGGQTERQRSTWIVTNSNQLNNYTRYYTPAIVDIMPTIARFMNIKLDDNIAREIDGISMIGTVSVSQPKLNFFQNQLTISWKALDTLGTAKIWLATENNFKNGNRENYTLMGEVPVQQEHILIDLKNNPSSFYKVVVEGKYNSVNRWFISNDNIKRE